MKNNNLSISREKKTPIRGQSLLVITRRDSMISAFHVRIDITQLLPADCRTHTKFRNHRISLVNIKQCTVQRAVTYIRSEFLILLYIGKSMHS